MRFLSRLAEAGKNLRNLIPKLLLFWSKKKEELTPSLEAHRNEIELGEAGSLVSG
jgi:hypothetical protein